MHHQFQRVGTSSFLFSSVSLCNSMYMLKGCREKKIVLPHTGTNLSRPGSFLALKLPNATEINSYPHLQQWEAVSGPSLPWQSAALAQSRERNGLSYLQWTNTAAGLVSSGTSWNPDRQERDNSIGWTPSLLHTHTQRWQRHSCQSVDLTILILKSHNHWNTLFIN